MKKPMQLTINDIANLISQCEKMNVVCKIEFFPMKKEKDDCSEKARLTENDE